MDGDCLVVLDCGATNQSVGAVSTDGKVLSLAQVQNQVIQQPGGRDGWYVWDLNQFWDRLCTASRQVCQAVGGGCIRGVLVTTFGTGGAPVSEDGTLLYPIISSYDTRCEHLALSLSQTVSPWSVYRIAGHSPESWRNNNLLKLIWLREHAPDTLDRAKVWLTMPGLLNFKLTGEMSLDATSAATIGALNLGTREWSRGILLLAQVDPAFFPPLIEPGAMIGHVTAQAYRESGLPEGIPVLAAGHDTQFAAVGSAARPDEVIVSSGTVEIPLIRESKFEMTPERLDGGLLTELDAVSGHWDTSILMVGCSALEWIRARFFHHCGPNDASVAMTNEGERSGIGSRGVTVIPSFLQDLGPTRKLHTQGTILGLSLFSDRGDIYRSALEGLSFQLRSSLSLLQQVTRYPISGLRVVGGGSRNALWNQIRADVIGLPVNVNACSETTILGAAMIGFVALGYYNSLEAARAAIQLGGRTFEPGQAREKYEGLYNRYVELLGLLKSFYA